MFCFFFFKQKTAYEMRISDWSSDVCSSDLGRWLYGGAYAELAVEEVELDGLAFTAYLQMNAATDWLQQVLLERRRTGALPGAFEQLIDAMEATYGTPSEERWEEHTSDTPTIMRLLYTVFCL